MLKALAPAPIPGSYIELITRYGFVELDQPEDPSVFNYSYREPELSMEFDGAISHFMDAARVRQYYTGLVLDEADDLPKFPNTMLPIGLDFGQSHVLLECGGESDRIWFWEFQGEPWGSGANVRLGFVADTLNAFLGKLHAPPD